MGPSFHIVETKEAPKETDTRNARLLVSEPIHGDTEASSEMYDDTIVHNLPFAADLPAMCGRWQSPSCIGVVDNNVMVVGPHITAYEHTPSVSM